MDVRIRDWTFTHWWVRPTVKIWFDFYHKSVTYSGTDNINWDKPIIFAPSHQNAFTDALCLILPTKYTSDRFIYPLIRADAFGKNSALDWMLTVFHMLPVYRPRDNVNIRQRNESVFSHCHEILFKNRNLLIHPEGNCIPQKQVGRFKKGLARIALGAEAEKNFDLGVNIVPVGINYRSITEPRQGIHIQFGQPILVSEYKEGYKNSEPSAIADLTRDVEEGVRRVTVDINTRNYRLTEEVLRILKNDNPETDTSAEYSRREVEFEKNTISLIKEAEDYDPKFTDDLRQSLQKLNNLLGEHNLISNLALRERKSAGRLAAEGIGYLALLPVFLYGWINNFIPRFLMNTVGRSISEKQFKNSARMVAGLLIFPISYLLQTLLASVFLGWEPELLLYLISLPLTGIASVKIREHWRQWIQQLRLKRISDQDQQKINELLDELIEKVNLAELNPSSHPV